MNDRSFQAISGSSLTFDPRTFAAWCRERWRVCAIAGAVAVGLTFVVSLALPKQYTSTSTILIGAPAGNDPRAAAAVNSVYLDSLKAWERVAGSDTLFARALENIRAGGTEPAGSPESLKKSILRINKLAGTALLEISVTLPDAGKAHAMAQFIAEQTAGQSSALDEKAGAEFNREFRDQVQSATIRLEQAEKVREALSTSSPVEGLEREVEAASGLNARLGTELALARADLAGYRSAPQAPQIAGAEARIGSLEMQRKEAAEQLTAKSARLEALRIRGEVAKSEFTSARAALDTANARLIEALATVRYRGERLRIVDAGVVPQKPSSPNVALNVLAALMLALGASVVYLAVTYGLHREGADADRAYSVR
jgi:uncharacterized protein involved in exopolysaccharide biosynthesis